MERGTLKVRWFVEPLECSKEMTWIDGIIGQISILIGYRLDLHRNWTGIDVDIDGLGREFVSSGCGDVANQNTAAQGKSENNIRTKKRKGKGLVGVW